MKIQQLLYVALVALCLTPNSYAKVTLSLKNDYSKALVVKSILGRNKDSVRIMQNGTILNSGDELTVGTDIAQVKVQFGGDTDTYTIFCPTIESQDRSITLSTSALVAMLWGFQIKKQN